MATAFRCRIGIFQAHALSHCFAPVLRLFMDNPLKAIIRPLRSFLRGLPGMGGRLFTPAQKLGRSSEGYVAEHLRSIGYTILQRNYRCKRGEIDIIAFRKGTMAFVEVRSRTGGCAREAQESVDDPKQKRIIEAARCYRAGRMRGEPEVFLRFDVAAVTWDNNGKISGMSYYEDAFRPD